MSDKIRVGGETIDPQSDKEYSSKMVRWLVDVAFENGKRAGKKELYEAIESRRLSSYKDGYDRGYADGSQDLQDFKDLLLRIFVVEAKGESDG